jgi:hypothetical protein
MVSGFSAIFLRPAMLVSVERMESVPRSEYTVGKAAQKQLRQP